MQRYLNEHSEKTLAFNVWSIETAIPIIDAAANIGKNIILQISSKVFKSPTHTPDLAKLLIKMIHSDKYGIYHATNEGFCSWYDFACEIFRTAKKMRKLSQLKQLIILQRRSVRKIRDYQRTV